jgi:hypothetical protein
LDEEFPGEIDEEKAESARDCGETLYQVLDLNRYSYLYINHDKSSAIEDSNPRQLRIHTSKAYQ